MSAATLDEVEAPCRDDQACLADDGACHTLVCTPSSATCSGNARVTCDATGTATLKSAP